VINVLPFSDRIILLKLYAKPVNINVIQVYAPTTDSTEDEIETFYEEVGEERFEALVGPYGLGLRNDRGERLCQFCQEENMKITNTWYKLPPGCLYTWKAPGDGPDNIFRNQIDYILINKRYGTSVKRVCISDYVLSMAVIKNNQNPCNTAKDRLRKT